MRSSSGLTRFAHFEVSSKTFGRAASSAKSSSITGGASLGKPYSMRRVECVAHQLGKDGTEISIVHRLRNRGDGPVRMATAKIKLVSELDGRRTRRDGKRGLNGCRVRGEYSPNAAVLGCDGTGLKGGYGQADRRREPPGAPSA